MSFHLSQSDCLQVQHAQGVPGQVAHLVGHAGQRLGGEGHGLLQGLPLVCGLKYIILVGGQHLPLILCWTGGMGEGIEKVGLGLGKATALGCFKCFPRE